MTLPVSSIVIAWNALTTVATLVLPLAELTLSKFPMTLSAA
jgi:hypothetical protein